MSAVFGMDAAWFLLDLSPSVDFGTAESGVSGPSSTSCRPRPAPDPSQQPGGAFAHGSRALPLSRRGGRIGLAPHRPARTAAPRSAPFTDLARCSGWAAVVKRRSARLRDARTISPGWAPANSSPSARVTAVSCSTGARWSCPCRRADGMRDRGQLVDTRDRAFGSGSWRASVRREPREGRLPAGRRA
jgi:hypothetical protein